MGIALKQENADIYLAGNSWSIFSMKLAFRILFSTNKNTRQVFSGGKYYLIHCGMNVQQPVSTCC